MFEQRVGFRQMEVNAVMPAHDERGARRARTGGGLQEHGPHADLGNHRFDGWPIVTVVERVGMHQALPRGFFGLVGAAPRARRGERCDLR